MHGSRIVIPERGNAAVPAALFPLLVLLFVSVFATPAMYATEGVNGNLVTAQWLEKNYKNSDVVLIDASPAPMYMAKHLEGAINVELYSFAIRDKSPQEMDELYQSWGVTPGKKIVMYDQGGSFLATRVFFALYRDGYPVKDLLVLDGGFAKWQELGFPVTKDATPAPKPGTFTIRKRNEEALARLPEVLAASGDPANNALVEALGPDWHFGQVQAMSKAGHIPNSTLLPSEDFFNPDKTFKSPQEIRKMLAYVGVRPEQQIYSYCGGGISASVPYFALKFMLGYPKVKLYAGSEMDWLSDERDLPYWTFDSPYLMRETNWLQFWNGQRSRSIGLSRVTVIDVRPAEAYNLGHLPFALNIPHEVFKANLNNPTKLAEILGPAGVDSNYEAVIVSGAGLTKESALAFLALEQLGQKKTSVFIDSFEQWTKHGYTLSNKPTIVGAKKMPYDTAITPTDYAVRVRNGVVVTSATGTQGVYPKVFIASGKELPAKPQDGKVVHVPYTELLNSDGTPKAAKDIFAILSKAGVPRYAELVCISDDPSEAAVNYYVLKLMGYPDIKVQTI